MLLDSPAKQPTSAPPSVAAETRYHRKSRDMSLRDCRIAIVHDFLYTYAGAERVLEQMIQVFPQADLFSLFDFLPAEQRGFLQGKAVKSSFLQSMPGAKKHHRALLPLMPLAIEQLDVSSYDIVLSSSYVVAKGIITSPSQLHVCYCHSPVRFAWDLQHEYLNESRLTGGIKSALARAILHYIRLWDVRSSNGVDAFVANSDFVAGRIRKCYRRGARTIYPPVDIERFDATQPRGDYYLTASRLVPYKRMDLIVEAFTQMPTRQLVVIGDGPELARLRAKATRNIRFLGFTSNDVLRDHLQRARAFVFAAREDFGIVAVEAQAAGAPVIGFGDGGLTESIVDGQTGVFFDEQSSGAVREAVERFERIGTWDAGVIRRNAERFSIDRFRRDFRAMVAAEWYAFRNGGRTTGSDDLVSFRGPITAANHGARDVL
jgi:glycosyltransferase involved in cell wall biosynthesis